MAGPSSPLREQAGDAGGGGSSMAREKARPRSFNKKTQEACWRKAAVVTGRDPERWRQDEAGNVVCRRFSTCHGCLCYDYDHIVPFSKGGECTVENCQILQTRVNRSKSESKPNKRPVHGSAAPLASMHALPLLNRRAE